MRKIPRFKLFFPSSSATFRKRIELSRAHALATVHHRGTKSRQHNPWSVEGRQKEEEEEGTILAGREVGARARRGAT